MDIRKLCIFVMYFGHKAMCVLCLCHSTPWTFHGVFLSQSDKTFGKVLCSTYPKEKQVTIGL